MSNLKNHALREFRAAGWTDNNGNFKDEMQELICKHVLKLIEIFSEEGHSGSSAPYAINLFTKLAKYEPIAPLTGEDSEWNLVYEDTYQNNRFSEVFKQSDRFDGKPYWMNGKIFWEWASHPDIDDGKPYKAYFTSRDSAVPIEFPWVKPESEYVFWPCEEYLTRVLDRMK